MARTYYATGTDATYGPTGSDWCKLFSATAPGSGSITAEVRKASTDTEYIVTASPEPGSTSWNGNYTFVWNNESGSSNIHLTVSFIRCNSSGAVQETIASDTGELTLSGVQDYTFTKTSAAWTSPSASDLFGVKLDFRNSDTKNNFTFFGGLPETYASTPHQSITTGTKTLTGGAYVRPTGDTTDIPWKSQWWFSDNNVDRYNDQANPFHHPSYNLSTSFTTPTTGAFGYGVIDYWEEDHPDTTYTVTCANNTADNRTYYFVRDVWISNVAAITQLHFRAIRDDFAIIFLNGTEVARVNVTGTPTHGQAADGAIDAGAEGQAYDWYLTDSGILALLVEGVNRIGVAVGSNTATSSDMAFDLELTSIRVATGTKTLTGGARVKTTGTKTLTGGSRVGLSTSPITLTGGSRVGLSTSPITLTGGALTKIAGTKTLTGGALAKTAGTKTLTGGALTRVTGTKTLTGGLLIRPEVVNFTGWESGGVKLDGEADGGSVGGLEIETSIVKSGSRSLKCSTTSTGTGYEKWDAITADGAAGTLGLSRVYFQIDFRPDTVAASNYEGLFRFRTWATSTVFNVLVNSSRQLLVYDSGTLIDTVTGTTLTDQWWGVRITFGIGTSSTYEIQLNSGSGWSTVSSGSCNTGSTACGYVDVGKAFNYSSQPITYYFDNLIISKYGFVDANSVVEMSPDGAGYYAESGWTGTPDGTNLYNNVDETPHDGGSSYNASNTAGSRYTAALESAASAGIVENIRAVKAHIICAGASSGSTVKVLTRSGTTDSETTSYAKGSTYSWLQKLFNNDPATGLPWTTGGLDGLQIGATKTSADYELRLSKVSAQVLYKADAVTGTKTLTGGLLVHDYDAGTATLPGGLLARTTGTKTLTGGCELRIVTTETKTLTGGLLAKTTGTATLPGGLLARTQGAKTLTGGALTRVTGTKTLTGGALVALEGTKTLTGGLLARTTGTATLPGGLLARTTGTKTLTGGALVHDFDAGTKTLTGGALVALEGTKTLAGGLKARTAPTATLTGGLLVGLETSPLTLTGGALARMTGTETLPGGLRAKTTGTKTLTGGCGVSIIGEGSKILSGGLLARTQGTKTLTGGALVALEGTKTLTGGLRARTAPTATLTGGLLVGLETSPVTLTGGALARLTGTETLTGGLRAKTTGTKTLTGGCDVSIIGEGSKILSGGLLTRTQGTATLTGGALARLAGTETLTGGLKAKTTGTATLTGGLQVSTTSTGTKTLTGGLRARTAPTKTLPGGLLVGLETSPLTLTGGLKARTAPTATLTGGLKAKTQKAKTLTGGARVALAGTKTLTGGALARISGTETLTGGALVAWAATKTLTGGCYITGQVAAPKVIQKHSRITRAYMVGSRITRGARLPSAITLEHLQESNLENA